MQVWSAAQSASPLKQAIVAAQQLALSLMHVLQVVLSNARPALPRHVAALAAAAFELVSSGGVSSLGAADEVAQAAATESKAARTRKRMGRPRSEHCAPDRLLHFAADQGSEVTSPHRRRIVPCARGRSRARMW